jgi:hypothetical protein
MYLASSVSAQVELNAKSLHPINPLSHLLSSLRADANEAALSHLMPIARTKSTNQRTPGDHIISNIALNWRFHSRKSHHQVKFHPLFIDANPEI